MAKFLGVDWGSRRVGLAVADDQANVVVTKPALQIESLGDGVQQIASLVLEEQISQVVVGFPLGLSGSRTAQTAQVETAVAALRAALSVPVALSDERLTSQAAATRGAGATDKIDSAAAADILTGYLERNPAV